MCAEAIVGQVNTGLVNQDDENPAPRHILPSDTNLLDTGIKRGTTRTSLVTPTETVESSNARISVRLGCGKWQPQMRDEQPNMTTNH